MVSHRAVPVVELLQHFIHSIRLDRLSRQQSPESLHRRHTLHMVPPSLLHPSVKLHQVNCSHSILTQRRTLAVLLSLSVQGVQDVTVV
jgi:hypothetical protein